jgi:hypothetical protein
LKSVGIQELAEFPPEHPTANVLTPQVVHERKTMFQKYFETLLAKPPNPELNAICLRFLRNTFKREENNMAF